MENERFSLQHGFKSRDSRHAHSLTQDLAFPNLRTEQSHLYLLHCEPPPTASIVYQTER